MSRGNNHSLLIKGKCFSSLSVENNLSLDTIEELQIYIGQNFSGDGFFVAYLENTIALGRLVEGEFVLYKDLQLEPKYIIKLRVFNEGEEIYLWRDYRNNFNARIRTDKNPQTDSDGTVIVDTEQILMGTKVRELDGNWCSIFEQRGADIILPFHFENIKEINKRRRISLLVRNYVTYNELGQAGYTDSRFISFLLGGDKID